MSFVNLHLHSQYSLLDGAIRADKLAPHLKQLGQTACAITDHGTLAGCYDFHKHLSKAGIKPIIGCEMYLAEDIRQKQKGDHLVLLARNRTGWLNLCKMSEISFTKQAFFHKPRIDWNILEQHSEGLLCLTACIGGPVSRIIRNDKLPLGSDIECMERLDRLFSGDLFVEIQYHGIPDERVCNARLQEIAKEMGLPIVCSNDSHYMRKEDKLAHDYLLNINTGKQLGRPDAWTFTGNYHVMSEDEALQLFPSEAVTNCQLVADMCEEYELGDDKKHYPKWAGSVSARDTLIGMCVRGFKERWGVDVLKNKEAMPEAYRERARYELSVISRMDFCDYFCVVADIVRFARSNDIPVGPGRGSGAGSLVAYLLGITQLDPIEHGLLFERFLNPDRVSPPDFDIDFCRDRRDEVVEYVRKKYGKNCVANISTYGGLEPKALLKDAARVAGKPFKQSLWLTSKVDSRWTWTETKEFLSNNADKVPEWSMSVANDVDVLEGVKRNRGTHACGIIIGDQPLSCLVPVASEKGENVHTQWDGPTCEELGLLKMDILGLKTLTVIAEARRLINDTIS